MSFAAPWLGWMAAVAGPVILFYLIRQRLRSQPVSTLLFWRQLDSRVHNTPLWRKLRRWFSLLLQLLFILLLVAALCRPLLPWQSAQASYLVLILDPSVSMSAEGEKGPRWAEALEAAEAQIDAMRFTDEATLILATDPPRILSSWTGRKADLKGALSDVEPTTTATDMRPALTLASSLAAGREEGRVTVITDGVWSVLPEGTDLANVNVQILGESEDNAGLTLFAVRRSLSAPGQVHLSARVENNREVPLVGELELLRDGGLIDVVPIEIDPGGVWNKDWTAQQAEAATYGARLNVDDEGLDVLVADDAAETRVVPVQPVKVTLISEPNGFLEAALSAQPLVEWTRLWPPELLHAQEKSEAVEAARMDPNTLFVFNGAKPPQGFAARNVLLLNPKGSGFWGQQTGEVMRPLISDAASKSDIMRFVDFNNVLVDQATVFVTPPEASVYAESFGLPLIYGDWEADARWMVLSFDLAKSDLVYRTAFPILLGNLMQSLRGEKGGMQAALPGPVESRLEATLPASLAAKETAVAVPVSRWWSGLPLWWWLVAAGFAWLLGEWFLYSRRMTE